MENKERIEYIDLFKGIGIVLMIINHAWFIGVFYNFSHAFHMPMFFIISGFLYSKKIKDKDSFCVFLKRKTKGLIGPYFTMGIFHYLIWVLVNGFSYLPLKRLLFYNTHDGMPIAGALWFLTALFFAEIFYSVLDVIIKDRRLFVCAIVGVAMIGTFWGEELNGLLPFAIGASLVGVGLFGIGGLFKRIVYAELYKKMMKQISLVQHVCVIVAFTVVLCFLIIKNGGVNMRLGRYSVIGLFWINASLATMLGMHLTYLFVKYVRLGMVSRFLCTVGEQSIVYLCLNQVVIFLSTSIIKEFKFFNLIQHVIVIIASFTILYFAGKLSFNTKLKVLFGK